jgi:oligosaccharide repeat unit polymerase
LIIIFAFSIYLLLSLSPISLDLQINIAIAFASFFIGTLATKLIFKEKTIKNFKEINFKGIDIYAIGFCLILIGAVFFFLSVGSVGGLPILKPSLRYALRPILTLPVFLIIPGIGFVASSYLNDFNKKKLTRPQIRFRFLALIVVGGIILFGLGYRTPLIAVLLILIIIGYYGKILAIWEIVFAILIAVGLIIGIGYFRSLEEFFITTNTSPFYSLQSRADFTLHVLNLLNYISGDFGLLHGKMIASSIPGSESGPRMLVGKLIAWRSEVTVTPTLIGPFLVDFGRAGLIIFMALLGFFLNTGFKLIQISKNHFYIGLYALLLTYAILGIETGILDIQVVLYFIIGFIIYLIIILKNIQTKN